IITNHNKRKPARKQRRVLGLGEGLGTGVFVKSRAQRGIAMAAKMYGGNPTAYPHAFDRDSCGRMAAQIHTAEPSDVQTVCIRARIYSCRKVFIHLGFSPCGCLHLNPLHLKENAWRLW